MSQVLRLFSSWTIAGMQFCYNVAFSEALNEGEISILKAIFGDGFSGKDIFLESEVFASVDVVEIGPRLSSATPYSTNAVSLCHSAGLKKIVRVERSRRYQLPSGADRVAFISGHYDRMTECEYSEPVATFDTGVLPEPTYVIPLMEEGPDAFLKFEGLKNLNPEERQFYYDYFVGKEKRNPTIVEAMDLYNANSEHCRHGYFKGQQIIDGVPMSMTLMDIVQGPYHANPGKSLMAFSDNSSGVKGYQCLTIGPTHPGQPSSFECRYKTYHIIATAETHNFPTGVAPVPGAETGAGGRIRDIQATGRGGIVGAGVAGYCVGQLLIPGYDLPLESSAFAYPPDLALPRAVLIGASNGLSDYGNKYGEPQTSGFSRSFGMRLPSGERSEFLKPVMYTAGIGMIDSRHMMKSEAKKGMLIVQIGGPAYRIGFGGGSASSLMQGDNEAHLDFNAVQRGDGEMKQKVNSVLRACIEMGENNPIESIHDQGAGGPANVLKELVEKSGGKIELRRIASGDPTMSVVELWICEYQERNGFLISPDRIAEFEAICVREKVNCEILGEVTGDGRFVVHDEIDGSTPVNFELSQVLGGMPQKTFRDDRITPMLLPFQLPETVTVRKALIRVLHDPAVGSKGYLVHKVDRSVGGLVVRQQCCGPIQLPVADNAIQALSFFSQSGVVTSIGEQPIKMLINPAAGARMAVGEALTNMATAKVSNSDDVWSSANWMWAAKLPGEGAAMWDAALAMSQLTQDVNMAKPNRGKDSLSMATRVGVEMVKSGRQLVIYAYAPMPDVTAHVTPDIKQPGRSTLIHIDMAFGKTRLGGSSLAHVYGQLGNESPDVDEPRALRRGFDAMQRLLSDGLILSAHDISDGGLIVTILEMAFAGNCGLEVNISGLRSPVDRLFAEELGWVVECKADKLHQVMAICRYFGLLANIIGTTNADDQVRVTCNFEVVIDTTMTSLREEWESTSYQLEQLQMNPVCAEKEKMNNFRRKGPQYRVSFVPSVPPRALVEETGRHRVAILREEGSNGYREMTAAFYQAGFMPVDVHMTDLLEGRITLDGFRGLVVVGGFSYADVPASAKGWASTIRFNPELKEMFTQFYARSDTFSLGVCNGCQLFGLLGIVPWAGISDEEQPRFVHNTSGRFESRWSTVKVLPSPAIMLAGMEGSVLGVWMAHGEGRFQCGPELLAQILFLGLAPVRSVDDAGVETENYPANPNGSPLGITALCTPDGRHLAMMPHPERVFLDRQWPWMPDEMKSASGLSPWLQMFINAWHWCEKNSGNK